MKEGTRESRLSRRTDERERERERETIDSTGDRDAHIWLRSETGDLRVMTGSPETRLQPGRG